MAQTEVHDLVVIGGGPAGLGAAITAEAQKVDTLVLECHDHLGGQAGTASLIENYPGFPEGISGGELTSRMVDQALKFATEFIAPARVTELEPCAEGIAITTDAEEHFIGRTALLAIGVDLKRLRARNLAAYLGRGASYGSPLVTADYEDKTVCIVGGADSAGQAAAFVADFKGANVHIIARAPTLNQRMSGYIVDKVSARKNIKVHTDAEVIGVDGNGRLEKIILQTGQDVSELAADQVFISIGSEPKTTWLPESVERDRRGFIAAGHTLAGAGLARFFELTNGRPPLPHETSLPGLFVAGDVRSGSDKWVSLAVADGAAVVSEIESLRIYNRLHHAPSN